MPQEMYAYNALKNQIPFILLICERDISFVSGNDRTPAFSVTVTIYTYRPWECSCKQSCSNSWYMAHAKCRLSCNLQNNKILELLLTKSSFLFEGEWSLLKTCLRNLLIMVSQYGRYLTRKTAFHSKGLSTHARKVVCKMSFKKKELLNTFAFKCSDQNISTDRFLTILSVAKYFLTWNLTVMVAWTKQAIHSS